MFVDLVGSTALSARLDPEDLRELIGAYHRRVAATVDRSGGFVAKYMGDGVLAYFGYPRAHEDDAERAVRAGLELVAAVGDLEGPAGTALRVRVGIATGLVVVGDLLGGGAAREQAVVGETPNLAARLQALAEPDSVVIAAATRRLVGGLFECLDLGAVEAKGFAGPVRAYRVLGPGTAESRFEAFHAAALAPLVGREEEMGLLLRRWGQAEGGEGRVVLLSGEAGVGKSRLLAAVQERLADEPHLVLRYFCSPHRQDSPLHPVIAQLERAAGFARGDPPEARLDQAGGAAGADLAARRGRGAAGRAAVAPDRRPLRPAAARPAAQARADLRGAAAPARAAGGPRAGADGLRGRALDRPQLARAARPCGRARRPAAGSCCSITFRPEFEPPWTGQPHVTALTLDRLGRREAAVLVRRITGDAALPDGLVAEIVERTDGVPLFVEELTKAVLEAEAAGTIAATPPAALAVPATLHASLMARLDRLGPAAREVAQVGAVIGREFSHELLAVVADRGEEELAAALGQLADAGLVFRRGAGLETGYLFKHALVRDVAYGTLLRERRRRLHAAVARALEERFPELAGTAPELVAHHLTEAGEAERAVRYWLEAGRRAAGRSADREAVGHLRRGLELLAGLPASAERDRIELEFQLAIGTPLIALHGWGGEPVAVAYERAGTLCEGLGDDEQARSDPVRPGEQPRRPRPDAGGAEPGRAVPRGRRAAGEPGGPAAGAPGDGGGADAARGAAAGPRRIRGNPCPLRSRARPGPGGPLRHRPPHLRAVLPGTRAVDDGLSGAGAADGGRGIPARRRAAARQHDGPRPVPRRG